MKSLLAEFKEFINRGNVIDMAVGIIIGAAFTAIVTSLTDDIINPFIKLITGGAGTSGDELDERVDDVVSQRRDDGGERRADDDADGHIDHVAAVDEFLELGQEAFHGRSLLT